MCGKDRETVKDKILKKSDIPLLLKAATSDWNIFAPLTVLGEDVVFSQLPKSGSELDEALKRLNLTDVWVVVPPKDICFPQLELMMTFDGEKINEVVESSPKLLFGLKACDLKGMLFADDFFSRNFKDKYYLSRKQKRLTVVIGCVKPPRPSACFCTSTGTGPFLDKEFDIQLVDLGDSFYVEIGSADGETFVTKYGNFFKDAQAQAKEHAQQVKEEGAERVELKVDFQKALEMMKDEQFNPEEVYKRIAERCIYCGGCLYTCPTCTCFNVFDEKKGVKGLRKRNWDACVFEGYTREASGHNPRNKKFLRTARRYEHKLKYDYRVTGKSGCVGCGRCLASCPVEIGISKFIEEITTDKKIM